MILFVNKKDLPIERKGKGKVFKVD